MKPLSSTYNFLSSTSLLAGSSVLVSSLLVSSLLLGCSSGAPVDAERSGSSADAARPEDETAQGGDSSGDTVNAATGGAGSTANDSTATGGMTSGSGGSGSTTEEPCTSDCEAAELGMIKLSDAVPGWASVADLGLDDGTTGGGQDLADAVTVSTMSALVSAASGENAAIIFVEPGTYSGTLNLGSNKTIIGKGPGVTIEGNIKISGVSNLIVRNLAVRGEACADYEACKVGPDAVAIENSAHHVWLDHLDIADGQDGNLDITKQADYVTVSLSQFHYTYDKAHRFSNLISSGDDATSDAGKLRITYMNCWWGERVSQRMPRGRFGKVHLLNNYYSSADDGQIVHGPGVQASYIIEGCYYDVPSGTNSIKVYDDSATFLAQNNAGSAEGMNQSKGSVFTIPYSFSAIAAVDVKALVTAPVGGAGNTCILSN